MTKTTNTIFQYDLLPKNLERPPLHFFILLAILFFLPIFCFIGIWTLFEIHNEPRTVFQIYPNLLHIGTRKSIVFGFSFLLGSQFKVLRSFLGYLSFYFFGTSQNIFISDESVGCWMYDPRLAPGNLGEASSSHGFQSSSGSFSEKIYAPRLDQLADAAELVEKSHLIVERLNDPSVDPMEKLVVIKRNFIRHPYSDIEFSEKNYKKVYVAKTFYENQNATENRYHPFTLEGRTTLHRYTKIIETTMDLPSPTFDRRVERYINICNKHHENNGHDAPFSLTQIQKGLLLTAEQKKTHPYCLVTGNFDQEVIVPAVYENTIALRNVCYESSTFLNEEFREWPCFRTNVLNMEQGLNSLPIHRKGRVPFYRSDVIDGLSAWFYYRRYRQKIDIHEIFSRKELSDNHMQLIVTFINQTWGVRRHIEMNDYMEE